MCGVASRRKAEELIRQGRVKVNGKIVRDYVQVEAGDTVEADGKVVTVRRKVYYLFNKPIGYLTTKRDPQRRRTIFDLIDVEEDVFPVGRLDKDTCGLLLLTNDGEVAQHLLHPKFQVERTYVAVVAGKVEIDTLRHMEKGLKLPYGYVSRMHVEIVKREKEKTIVKISIKQGKKREIRRAFGFVGHQILMLKRIAFGPIVLDKKLPEGKYRPLSSKEIASLRKMTKKNETL